MSCAPFLRFIRLAALLLLGATSALALAPTHVRAQYQAQGPGPAPARAQGSGPGPVQSPAGQLAGSRQALLVLTNGWDSRSGEMRLFERSPGQGWRPRGPAIPVILGKNGLAWGRGLLAVRGRAGHRGRGRPGAGGPGGGGHGRGLEPERGGLPGARLPAGGAGGAGPGIARNDPAHRAHQGDGQSALVWVAGIAARRPGPNSAGSPGIRRPGRWAGNRGRSGWPPPHLLP